ncbi:hypothetical protein HPP92_003491 [Vanilla planifolia]|uniref:F-box domain-containing protein n=1 Tax=Vanilla planifolia TaxID=51239 RepID=A0A835S3A9_VANPL|nr:hypothetical protein HPP92_003491 [Vanilla planifolia]
MKEPYRRSFVHLCFALGSTALCVLFAFWTFRKENKRMACGCSGSCDGSAGGGCSSTRSNGDLSGKGKASVAERQTGASMMEQLVPEITTHALSYLDYTSLCRLSMTNSAMRRAANDDNAWKALYHKDFTLEQDNLTPTNGWKSYYAATKAIIDVNQEFYNIVRERLLPQMSRFWLHADYVKCIHSSGELSIGYNAVMNSWGTVFDWGQGPWLDFQIHDVRARVSNDMAWVTMKAYVDVDSDAFFVTNIFEFLNGRWFMVHHHTCVLTGEAGPGPGQLNGFAFIN